MAITRTTKGTAQSKAANTGLQIANVSMIEGDLLLVGLCFETDAALNTVKWGNRSLKPVGNTNFVRGDTRTRMYRAIAGTTATRNLDATWAANMSARCMIAVSISGARALDLSGGQDQASGTSLDTTNVGASTIADTISIAFFGTGGPSGDAQGTAGSGHTLGQRIGTTGAGAGSNVTLQETFEILTATGVIQSTLTLSTARISANSIAAFAATKENQVAIAPSDLEQGRDFFAGKATPLDYEAMSFYWNDNLNRWEVYDRGADIDSSDTLIGHMDPDDGAWTEV